jgi:hypothetical protein
LPGAAIYRDRLRKDATSIFEPEQIAGAALLPAIGKSVKADISQALTATPADTARDLRDVKRDQAMTCKALNILAAGEPDAYARALAALREDTRSYWLECLEESSSDDPTYKSTAEALQSWIRRHWTEVYEEPIAELEHRDAIREQAFGSAYASQRLEVTARYEVHLDRKLERTLAMLIRLRELRPTTDPAWFVWQKRVPSFRRCSPCGQRVLLWRRLAFGPPGQPSRITWCRAGPSRSRIT